MDGDKLAAIMIRHALATYDVGASTAADTVRLLNTADAELSETLAARYALIASKGFDRGAATTRRIEDMLKALRAINSAVYAQVGTAALDAFIETAEAEFGFTANAIDRVGGAIDIEAVTPTPQYLKTLVTKSPIAVDNNGSALLSSWLDGLEDGRMKRLEGAIRQGLLQGQTTDQIVQRVVGTKAAKYADGILDISRRSAQSMVLTANATIANAAREETYRKSATIRYVEFSAILDARTSPKCQSLSGKIWALDEPHPVPPMHIRCRSMLIPRSNDTDPPKHKPYHEWLKGQSAKVQDERLGKAKGAAYRAGNLKAEDLYRNDGTFRSIKELKAIDADILATS